MINKTFFSVGSSYKNINNQSGILDMADSVKADDIEIDIEGSGEKTSLIGKAK
jgi:hypothetical protein